MCGRYRTVNGNNLCVSQQVNGTSSSSFIKTTSLCQSSKTILLSSKKEEPLSVVNHDLGITRNLSRTRISSDSNTGAHEHNGLCRLPFESQPIFCPGSLTGSKTDIKHQTNLENHSHFGNHSEEPVPMLSSTMVTVLAPQWSGLVRRTKRFDGTGYSEAQGDSQDVSNTSPNQQQGHQRTWGQHGVKNVLADESNIPRRVPLLETRSNKAGWSSKSAPSCLDFNTKKDMIQTVSLDADALSPSPTSPMSWSPLSPNLNEQRIPQMGLQGRQSSLSSKPTTSRLLLSSRKFNLNSTNSGQNPVLSEVKTSSLNSSLNNNEQERTKSILASSISYRTTETGPILSPVGSNPRERKISDKFLFLTSTTNRTMKDNSYTRQSQSVTQAGLASSKSQLLGKDSLERQQNFENSDNTNSFSESSISPTRYFQYDSPSSSKTHTLPRRTSLKCTSWWKQVSQEDSSPLTMKNTDNKKHYQKTDSPSQTDNKRMGSYNLKNSDNSDRDNNTLESVCKGNMNRSLKTRPSETGKAANHKHGLNVDNREPQKLQSMPDCVSASKLSTVPEPTPPRLTKVPDKDDERKTLFTAHVPAPTLFTPTTPNPPTDSFGKYSGSPPETSALTSQNNMETQKLTKLPLFHNSTTLSSQPCHSQTSAGPSSGPNTKNKCSFQSNQVSSNINIHSSSNQTSKFTSTSNVSPLGFKRSYVCLPKPYKSQPVTTLISTINTFNKTRGSYISASPTTSSGTTPHSPSTLTPPVNSAIASPTSIDASSPLTPPATPVNASPSSEPSPPKLKSIVYNSLEREPKKQGKRERRVTWQDSVELQRSESDHVEKLDSSQVQANSPAPSHQPQGSPSRFSYLQSGCAEGSGSPVCAPNHKTFGTQVVKGGKYRSSSSDFDEVVTRELDKSKHIVGDTRIFDKGPSTTRQECTPSVESGTVQCRSSAPLSLPPDFPSGYKHRYSTPPYSTLMSTRQTHENLKTSQQTFLVSQPSLSNQTPQSSSNANLFASTSKPPIPPIRPSQPFSMQIQTGAAKHESSICNLSDTDWVNNNCQDHIKDQPIGQIQLFDNRVHVTSQSHSEDEKHSFSSTYVTETLVYRIKTDSVTEALKNTTPSSSQHNKNALFSSETKLNQQPGSVQSRETVGQSCRHVDESSSDGISTKSEPSLDETSNTGMKESVLGKNRFHSVEVNNEESSKKNLFGLKRSVSSPSSTLPKSEPERVNKTYNKMDQMFNKLKQKFRSRRTEDDLSFPWQWKRTSQTPSMSGSSDKSSISNISADSTKTLEDQTHEEDIVLKHNAVKTEDTKRQTDNRYTLIPAPTVNDFSIWSENNDDPNSCAAPQSKVNLTVHGPIEQFDVNKKNSVDGSLSPNAAYSSQSKKSTPSPRSPFSPFSSLSPVSPFSSGEVFDDNVFFSPKLQRRRESSSPLEPVDGIRLGLTRRSRVSTGPPTSSPGKDKEPFTSSYADLKYGIEPGRSFSVSSVHSSRPAQPGRISTGTRFMSVGDLSQPALSSASGSELHQWSATPTEMGQFYNQPDLDPHVLYDAGKQRSRSLPRSLTQCLAKWSSGVPPSQSTTATPSKSGRLRSPSMNICQFPWDTEGLPTPPPTPPLSPAVRRMSKPSSLPSPTSPEAVHQVDGQPSRLHRPFRGFVSSLGTFDESSDSSSDTTTDDEYYIDSDGGEKETEL